MDFALALNVIFSTVESNLFEIWIDLGNEYILQHLDFQRILALVYSKGSSTLYLSSSYFLF